MSRRKEPTIPAELLDQLLAGSDAASALDQGGLLDSLKKALAERALNAEMDHHLGGDEQAGNSRNGYGRKCAITDGEHRAVPGAREDAQRWKKLPPGSSVRSIRPIRWCFSTPFASRSAMTAWFAAKLFISRLASALMAAKRFSACGLNKMRVPNSGCAL